jgi:hypothetical protein
MTEMLFVSKKEKSSFSRDDVLSKFEATDDLDKIKSYIEKAEDRLFVAWSTVDAVDKSGERIPIADVIKTMEDYMQMPSINDEHTNGVVGKCLAYKVLVHPETRKFGVLQLNEIFKRNDREDSVWKDIKEGKKTGLSVGGIAGKNPQYEMSDSGSIIKVLTGFQQYETSVVENPCNPHALNEAVSAVAKSQQNTEKMAEEIKKETVATEEVAVTKESEDMVEESPSVSIEEVVNMVQSIMSRLDEIESAMSGKPEEEGEEKTEEQVSEESEEEKTEESESEDEEEEDTEEKKKTSELESQVAELTKSNEELQEKLKSVEVVKAERPATVTKSTLNAYDVAMGKARVVDGQIVER